MSAIPPAVSPAAASLTMSPTLVVLVLAALLGLQPITTDLYLPALPALTEGFAAPMSQAQLTLGGLLLAFGISQLFWGPLSDRFGRRPILLCGLGAYVVAAIGCALAPTMLALIGWRVVQGAAMGAAVMCARAMVRDLYHPVQGASIMSKGQSGLGAIACLCVPLGGLLSELFNWRVALLALAVFGASALLLIVLRFQETLPQKNLQALQTRSLARNWWAIARHPTFLSFSLLSTCTYGGLFTFLASSSFVFLEVLGLSKMQYGLVMFSMSFVYLSGTFLCRRLLPRFGVRRSVAIAAALSLSGGGLMAALAWLGVHNVWAVAMPFYLFILAHGIHQPCSQTGAIGPFPRSAGAASALNGFLMMLAAFAMAGWLGSHMNGTVYPLAYGVLFWSVCIALTAWTVVQKYGDPVPPPTSEYL
jgi:DHA1 family bicyclomycin/chloramphenicol resistance-like MFS transporter